ncbi:hypothetical protein D3C78_951930 [compost metagenome]
MSSAPGRLIDAQYPGTLAESATADAGLRIQRGIGAIQFLILAKVGGGTGIGANRQCSAVDLLLLAPGGLVDRENALVIFATAVDQGPVIDLCRLGEGDDRYGQADKQVDAQHVSDLL